jgi:Flp pilus assembly protein TadB
MGGWLWAFGIPLFMLGPFLAVPRPERPAPAPMTPGQQRRRRRVLIPCIALLVLILVPWWARIALVLTAIVVIALLVAWGQRDRRRRLPGAK